LVAGADEDTELYVWLMSEPGGGLKMGEEVRPRDFDVIPLGHSRKALLLQGQWFVADRVRTTSAPDYAEVRRMAFTLPRVASQHAALDSRPPISPAPQAPPKNEEQETTTPVTPRAEAPRAAVQAEATADVRTLWVDWDAHGERWKPWREAVRESTSETFKDAPLEGASTALHMCKGMERMGGCPRLWLDRWSREKRLEPTDRVMHEMRVLTEALRLFGTYDQVNLGALAGVEALCRRIALIVDAYHNPAKPSWENAKFFSGTAATEEVVAPALRSHVLRRAKDEVEVLNARARSGGLRGQPTGDGAFEDEAADGGGGDGKGRGRGRGRRGRGVPAPAQ